MYVVMGANGHVGSAVATTLLQRGMPVSVVTHDAAGSEPWRSTGAQVVEADVNDVGSLRAAFRLGRRAFVLNPPADISLDTDMVERRTVANILAALDGSGLEKIVAESTGGAQPGERIGDLSVLWEFEQGLEHQSIPAAVNRGAYYMSNWDPLLDAVRSTGTLPTLYPADLALPMIAPRDLGEVAADRLLSSAEDTGIRFVEGPRRYSSTDVALAFSQALGQPVKLSVTPPAGWKQAYLTLGFSEAAAESFTRMTAVIVKGGFETDDQSIRGATEIDTYIRELVHRRPPGV